MYWPYTIGREVEQLTNDINQYELKSKKLLDELIETAAIKPRGAQVICDMAVSLIRTGCHRTVISAFARDTLYCTLLQRKMFDSDKSAKMTAAHHGVIDHIVMTYAALFHSSCKNSI